MFFHLPSFTRMWAISVRHIYQFRRDSSRWTHVFYWPLLDIILWGFSIRWMSSDMGADQRLSLAVLAALALWQIVVRSNFDVSITLLEDIESYNVVNLFSSPLSVFEWIGGIFLFACINLVCTFCYCTLLVKLLYGVNILVLGWRLIPIVGALFITGLALGFFSAGILIYRGRRIAGFVYLLGWMFAPVSSVFYPIHVLSPILQKIAWLLPAAHIFEGLRSLVLNEYVPLHAMAIGSALAAAYFTGAVFFFHWMFTKSCTRGLARLSQ